LCKYFETVWQNTLRLAPNTIRLPHRTELDFPRLDVWRKRQPPTSSKRRCKCGEPDSWRCWIRTQGAELMGESRRDNGTLLLKDREVIDPEELKGEG
jgi:hypothetical protein